MSWELIPHGTRIDFIGKRHWCALLSTGVLVASAIAVFVNGIHLGIDFAGGTEVQLAFAKDAPASEGAIRDVLRNALEIDDASVVRYGEVERNEYLIKFKSTINEASEGEDGAAAPDEAAAGESTGEASDLIIRLGKALEGAIGAVDIERVEFVGPKVGEELRADGLKALLYSSLAILVYIAFRFNTRYAPGAVVASIHDLLVTAGILVILGMEFDLRILAAMLAILGYSLNDTIIIYDRVRENMTLHTSVELADVMNQSVNQTLSRTVLTSGTTLIALLALFFLGGPVIRPFAFTMILGIIVGTYSSVYIAAPVLLELERRFGGGAAAEIAAEQRRARQRDRDPSRSSRSKGKRKAGAR